ncbi:hypothetical protein BST95_06700 [Halioglobus japonicus]|uniref:Uncharacterized protein n=1 Tax=Halioglobus japonicus TaxID=930805 RepID=A0AAP8MB98_9GAMM|nr:hypothetical protein BST95_06700 [Halioglobus japonicus]PLW84499.1 hypothetical protein C0029_18905 [Halioglobus japonicus]
MPACNDPRLKLALKYVALESPEWANAGGHFLYISDAGDYSSDQNYRSVEEWAESEPLRTRPPVMLIHGYAAPHQIVVSTITSIRELGFEKLGIKQIDDYDQRQ